MKKRLLAMLMLVAMLLALVCGCGSKDEAAAPAEEAAPAESSTPAKEEAPTEEATPAEEAAPTEEAAPADPYAVTLPITDEVTEITIYAYDRPFLWENGLENYDDNTVQEEQIKRTNVHPQWSWFSGIEQLQVNIASGDYYDMYWQLASFYNGGLSKAYDDEVIIDLKDLVTTYMPNYYKALEDDGLALKCTLDSAGHMLGIYEMYTAPFGTNGGSIIREDMLNDLGLTSTDIVTYDDLHDALLRMKTELGVKSPVYMFSNGTPSANYLASGFDTSGKVSAWVASTMPFYKDGSTIHFAGSEDNFLEYITMLREWYADGLFDSDFLSHQDTNRPDADPIYTSEVGYYFWNYEVFGEHIQNGTAYDPDFDIRAIADPVKEEGQVLKFTNGVTWTMWTDFDCTISTACDPDLAVIACRWMDYGYSEEGILLNNYGVEGLSFEYVDGEPMLIEDFLYDNYLVGDAGLQMVKNACLGTNAIFAQDKTVYDPFDNQYGVEARYIWESNMVDSYEESADILGAVSINPEVSNEYSTIMNEVMNTLQEWMTSYIMGERDASGWDDMVQSMYDFGLQQCIDWYQEAYDEFMSR